MGAVKRMGTNPKGGPLKRFFGWWLKGPWWAKAAKMLALAVFLYNVVTFVLMWCPPVQGIVLDIDTHRPIEGALVQKQGLGPFAFPAMTQAGGRTGGGEAERHTDPQGRFSFPGVFAHPTHQTHAWFGVLWPFQWLDTIDLTVWHPGYIGVSSLKEGFWWRADKPRSSGGYCMVSRYRIPLLGFRYTILLRRPETESEWQVKIGSVNLGGLEGGQKTEEERLFNDLTGYLERWPKGEKAGEYYKLVWETASLVPCNPHEREDFARGELGRERLQIYCYRAAKIIALAEGFPKTPLGMTEESFKQDLQEERNQLSCGKELLEQKRGLGKGAGK